MVDLYFPPTLDDLRRDETIDPVVARRLEEFFAADGVVRRRGMADGRSFGDRLVSRCPEPVRLRYETLLHHDGNASPKHDFGLLIAAASVILEAELDRLIAEPVRAIADGVIQSFPADKKSMADRVAKWARREINTSLGPISLLLLGLHYGAQQEKPEVMDFIQRHFTEQYRRIIAGDKLVCCINEVNQQFRIPACHGHKTFDEEAYEAFMRKIFGHERTFFWHEQGPDPLQPPDESAVLHHHWREWSEPIPAPLSKPIDRLLHLAARASSSLQVTLQIETENGETAPAARDVFRRGNVPRIRFSTNANCHAALIDVGAFGGLSVLWPNAVNEDTFVRAGQQCILPSETRPRCAPPPEQHAGCRRMIAVAALDAWNLQWLSEDGDRFRTLGDGDVESLLQEIEGRSPDACGLAVREFRVKP